ncbi:NAD-dependent epimerase/dehydratase family protein [Haloarcula sp. 1CSR25-25]|uniref:NAD-dependent epimerase/dehydratase family protein n=1 Tax=Haloarcula sp. 1CSR25-25 TaxID=2862545 RepID=UPI002893FDF6|nr:NAD-dependent epimerase/dehydratase family protein [Haloarcula sp. 1CSR25-25]MDT3435460.1 NAD-dependent epimerase/dehydratase family protein [Haloarcula sp. 1CSR25-25]
MAKIAEQLGRDKILVTGGAGFIGSHIADAVSDAYSVTVYDNFNSGARRHVPDCAEVIEADIRNKQRLNKAVAQADTVFHQAAQVGVTQSVQNPVESHATNLDPLLTILEAVRGTDTRVVFASSAAIYGNPEYTPIDEAHPKTPTAPYGLEKLSADHYCRLYHERYSVEAVALRYFNVYGPRQQAGDYSAVISILSEQALNENTLTIHGDGTQTRDFVHVEDIVQANLRAATEDGVSGRAFNIGTGKQTSINDLADIIKQITNSDSEVSHVDAREGDIDQSVADISHAQKYLNYVPKYDIETGLLDCL